VVAILATGCTNTNWQMELAVHLVADMAVDIGVGGPSLVAALVECRQRSDDNE